MNTRISKYSLVIQILAFGLPGVVLGASVIMQVPERPAEVALGILTAGLGLYSWLNPGLGQDVRQVNRDPTVACRPNGSGSSTSTSWTSTPRRPLIPISSSDINSERVNPEWNVQLAPC